MEHLQEEKKEALQAVGEYLEKLIPGIKTLCSELKGDRQPDTDDFQKQCIEGLNWVIEVYNRVSDIIAVDKIHVTKEELNNQLIALGDALRNNEDTKIAEILEGSVVAFLTDLANVAK